MEEIKMKDCRFFVNEEKRTVACSIENTRHMFRNYIEDELNMGCIVNYTNSKILKTLRMPPRFTGTAHCSPEDTWKDLTDNGQIQGIYRYYNSSTGKYELHINASCIGTGILKSNDSNENFKQACCWGTRLE